LRLSDTLPTETADTIYILKTEVKRKGGERIQKPEARQGHSVLGMKSDYPVKVTGYLPQRAQRYAED